MFPSKRIFSKSNILKQCLLTNTRKPAFSNNLLQITHSSGVINRSLCYDDNQFLRTKPFYLIPPHRKWYSKSLLDGDVTELVGNKHEKELKKVTDLFPKPRVTLNELANKTPDKIFDVHYKQNVVTPKGGKKMVKSNDWTCTYTFVWPEKMKFESAAISKRQAAEKAATQALHWLYANKRINEQGSPIYDKTVIDNLRNTLNIPIEATISEQSMERIDRIWNDYEIDIRDIYEKTLEKAKRKMIYTSFLKNDSSLDDEDILDENTDLRNEIDDIAELKAPVHPVYGRDVMPLSQTALERRERALQHKFEMYDEALTPLPIDQYTDQITSTIENSRVSVLVGAAGCGKSTRAPATILRHCGAHTAAIVSEPRRVAAIGLAQRVASELGENVGESIGYQVRLDAKPPKPIGGSVLYCTSGVLLRRLQLNPGLEGCTHVFIDEAHERDVNTDITLLLLKRALDINPQLKIVIMSATLDTKVFIRYFVSCPVIEVPGRTYPVELSYLKDIEQKFTIRLPHTGKNCEKEYGKPHVNCQEVVEVIKAVDRNESEGAILVFLPGWAEINLTKQLLDQYYRQSTTHMILPVHSRLSTTEQKKMFEKPLRGIRKIVLATNIAETSITIPDVVYVIDSGAHKENRIKEGTGTASLETVWVSRAAAKQRTGRAGRVQVGHCFRLYTPEKEAEFTAHATPEILRIPLEQTVLDCKTYAPDNKVEDFLSQLPEPPSRKAIQFAVNDLIDLGALTRTEQLTRLGSLLSTLTLHPRLGSALINAAVVGNVVSAADVATHCSTGIELFIDAADRRDEIREIKRKHSKTSDHAALRWIQHEFEQMLDERGWKAVNEWCEKQRLRKDRLNFVKSLTNLHLTQLVQCGIVEPNPEVQELNRFSNVDELTVASLLSGANSLLVTRRLVKTKGKLKTAIGLFTSKGDRAHIGSESVNYAITKCSTKTNLLAYFGGYHSTERRALVVHKTSLISPQMALLFCKGDINKENSESDETTTILCLPRHKLKIHVPTSQSEYILKAREMLWKTFEYHIERDTKNLDYDEHIKTSRFKVRLFKAIGRILIESNKEYNDGKMYDDICE